MAAAFVRRKFNYGRSRFRGTFSTDSLVDFAKYVSDRSNADEKGFINQDEMTSSVLFNLSDEVIPATPMIALC